ncbi:MAG TPA: VOC family protein [Propionicimonas sp.]|jgi:catechol 2,3-dioxygenase-like lactoylglutathione lyase family enzyme|uniref:VOC family protein n=1 Tax=Propionicimonas sp. TaxID=1955623 RepID=UPI002F42FEC7
MDTGCTLTTITLGTPDVFGLATFYARLLGWDPPGPVAEDEDWLGLRNADGGIGLAFQLEPTHARPVWPQNADDQQMQVHLEVLVDDLEKGVAHALACGASLAGFQPQEDVRVCLDPAGHPFCLWIET